MSSKRTSKKSYSRLLYAEKVVRNWRKTRGLFTRGEYSVSILRASTAMELAANLVIQSELVEKKGLPVDFVEKLMKWANGINGKFINLIYPILANDPTFPKVKDAIDKIWRKVNTQRNSIVHSGEFRSLETAYDVVNDAHLVITTLIHRYKDDFSIKKLDETDCSTAESNLSDRKRRLNKRK
jgi:hypothetical protein